MSLVGLSDLFLQKTELNVKIYSDYQRVACSIAKTEWTMFGVATLLLLIVTWGLLIKAYIHCSRQSPETINLLSSIHYSRSLLPLSLVLLAPFCFLLLSLTFRLSYSQSKVFSSILSSLFLLISTLIISMALAGGFLLKNTQTKREIFQTKSHYMPTFSLFLYFQIIWIVLWVKFGLSQAVYPLLIQELLFFVWILYAQPYPLALDTVGVLFTVSLDIIFQLYLFLRDQGVLKANY